MGEIMEDNPAFLIMYDFAKQNFCNVAVDIGTFTGMGSLRAMINGFLQKNDRSNLKIYSFESNKKRAIEALQRYKSGPFDMSFLEVHIGKISENGFLTIEQAMKHPQYEGIKGLTGYYAEEKEVYDLAPYVGDVLPNSIDLVCMDGGEFSSPGDWATIKPKFPKMIVLDDIGVFKNFFINEELQQNPLYKCIFMAPIRNGISIFLRNDVDYNIPSQITSKPYCYINYPLVWEEA